MCSRLFLIFSSISFSASGFMWRSLIYLDFEQGDKNGSVPLVENAVFYSLDGFHSFVKDQVTIGVWIHFWVFNSIPLVYLSVAIPVPCSFYHNCSVVKLEFRHGDCPRGSFIVENSVCYPRFFVIPVEFANCPFEPLFDLVRNTKVTI